MTPTCFIANQPKHTTVTEQFREPVNKYFTSKHLPCFGPSTKVICLDLSELELEPLLVYS